VILWDGGNNDFSFYKPDLSIVIADPHRAGHELTYHPGEMNFRSADVIVISKVDTASPAAVRLIEQHARDVNPRATIAKAGLTITANNAAALKGKRVLVVEDGPTLTHGGMAFGAGTLIARRNGASIVDAERHAVGSIRAVYRTYPHLKKILPAMGYGRRQIRELAATINRTPCDIVIDATPVNLSKIMKINKPLLEVEYQFAERGSSLRRALEQFEKRLLK